MCKLAAMVDLSPAKTSTNRHTLAEVKTLKHLFYINSFGQTDGSGLMGLTHMGEYYYHKRAIPSPDFLSTSPCEGFFNSIGDYRFMAFHTRYGTVGSNSDANSHPFMRGDTILMQNGTIDPYTLMDDLVPSAPFCPATVDSDAVAWAIDKQGVEETMKHYKGAGVFMWIDAQKRTFHIVKNSERNLHVLKVKGKDKFIFSTDYHALALAADRSNLIYESIEAVPNDILHTYDLEGNVTTTPLVVPETWTYDYGNNVLANITKLGKTKRIPHTNSKSFNKATRL